MYVCLYVSRYFVVADSKNLQCIIIFTTRVSITLNAQKSQKTSKKKKRNAYTHTDRPHMSRSVYAQFNAYYFSFTKSVCSNNILL